MVQLLRVHRSIAKPWNQPISASAGEWVKKCGYTEWRTRVHWSHL